MDNFHEEIVVRQNKGLASAAYIFANIFMVLFALVAAMFFPMILTQQGFNYMALIIVVLMGGLAFLLFYSRNFLKVEYEYSFTNGLFEVAKVINNRKRKEMMAFRIKEIELMAPIFTNGFERYQSMKDIKTVKAFLNRDAKKYFMVLRYKDEKTMLVLEPRSEMVRLMKKYNSQAVKAE